MSGLPRMYTRTIIDRHALTDTALDLDGYLRYSHVDRLASKGYAPVGEIEIRKEPEPYFEPMIPRPSTEIFTISETAVAWRAEA